MAYELMPVGIWPVPKGGIEPNSSNPCFSMAVGKFVALHRTGDEELWVVFQNVDGHWVTLHKATKADVLQFRGARAAVVDMD